MATSIRSWSVEVGQDNPWAGQIERFFLQEFPTPTAKSSLRLDAITDAIVGSNQTRYGPAPSPEVLVSIRAVVKRAIDEKKPIQLYLPWGSKKARPHVRLDIAELMALKQVDCLVKQIGRLHEPGVRANLMMEDAGGLYLWAGDFTAADDTALYTRGMVQLIKCLGFEYLNAVPESSLINSTRPFEFFNATADEIQPVLQSYLAGVAGLSSLHEMGWKGNLPDEQVNFYLEQYTRIYPNLDDAGRRRILSRYFAQAWARYTLKMKNGFADPNDAIIINFSLLPPGTPDVYLERRMFYRTLPMRFARTHLPPWRGRGYLLIEGNTVTPKVTHFGDPVLASLTPHAIAVETPMVGDAYSTQLVTADYLVKE